MLARPARKLAVGDALELRQQALALLDRLPSTDAKALHALGEAIAGTDAAPLIAFLENADQHHWLSLKLCADLRTNFRHTLLDLLAREKHFKIRHVSSCGLE